jgi:hypothetical protein
MVDHSPFAVATAVALPEATADFAKDLYIANAARSPEGDMVTIMSSSDRNFKKYLTTREPVDGYSIAQIDWSEDVGKTKVTISKDGRFATLTFNQALLSQAESAGRPVVDQMPTRVPIIPSPRADQASRAHARGVVERHPQIASAPPSNPAPPPAPSQQELLLHKQQMQRLLSNPNPASVSMPDPVVPKRMPPGSDPSDPSR